MESFNDFRSPIDEEPESPPADGIEVEEMEVENISLEGNAEDSDNGRGEGGGGIIGWGNSYPCEISDFMIRFLHVNC